jgi:type I restriction enzyme M protein
VFIDKNITSDSVLLVDASNLGEKIKIDGKNQKTVLRESEISKIIETFANNTEEKNFSIAVPLSTVEKKKYSFSAGQYFEVEVEHIEITEDEFNERIEEISNELREYEKDSSELTTKLIEQLGRLRYE